jgi:hypothetical protein
MHHVPALFLHPSRRLRAQALATHAEILRAKPLRARMFFYLREVASAEQIEFVLGSWCMATRDPERHAALVSPRTWDMYVSLAPTEADADAGASSDTPGVDKEEEGENRKLILDAAQMTALAVFVQRALLDPLALHAYLNPVQVPVDITVPKTVRGRPVPTVSAAAAQTRKADTDSLARTKGESEEESETDRKARLRVGALGVLQWILGAYTVPSSNCPLLSGVSVRCSFSRTRTQITR